MYSAYNLNKQGDNVQPWGIPFPIWNQSIVSCPFLTVASWPAYRFLRSQVRWSGIRISFKNFPQLVVIYTVKGFGVVSKAEVDVFLELFCFFDDPMDAGNLISGSSAFSKSSLNIWKFSVHVLLKPSLENFEHYLASVWNENFQMFKCIHTRDQIANIHWIIEKAREFQKNIYFALLTTLQPLSVCCYC